MIDTIADTISGTNQNNGTKDADTTKDAVADRAVDQPENQAALNESSTPKSLLDQFLADILTTYNSRRASLGEVIAKEAADIGRAEEEIDLIKRRIVLHQTAINNVGTELEQQDGTLLDSYVKQKQKYFEQIADVFGQLEHLQSSLQQFALKRNDLKISLESIKGAMDVLERNNQMNAAVLETLVEKFQLTETAVEFDFDPVETAEGYVLALILPNSVAKSRLLDKLRFVVEKSVRYIAELTGAEKTTIVGETTTSYSITLAEPQFKLQQVNYLRAELVKVIQRDLGTLQIHINTASLTKNISIQFSFPVSYYDKAIGLDTETLEEYVGKANDNKAADKKGVQVPVVQAVKKYSRFAERDAELLESDPRLYLARGIEERMINEGLFDRETRTIRLPCTDKQYKIGEIIPDNLALRISRKSSTALHQLRYNKPEYFSKGVYYQALDILFLHLMDVSQKKVYTAQEIAGFFNIPEAAAQQLLDSNYLKTDDPMQRPALTARRRFRESYDLVVEALQKGESLLDVVDVGEAVEDCSLPAPQTPVLPTAVQPSFVDSYTARRLAVVERLFFSDTWDGEFPTYIPGERVIKKEQLVELLKVVDRECWLEEEEPAVYNTLIDAACKEGALENTDDSFPKQQAIAFLNNRIESEARGFTDYKDIVEHLLAKQNAEAKGETLHYFTGLDEIVTIDVLYALRQIDRDLTDATFAGERSKQEYLDELAKLTELRLTTELGRDNSYTPETKDTPPIYAPQGALDVVNIYYNVRGILKQNKNKDHALAKSGLIHKLAEVLAIDAKAARTIAMKDDGSEFRFAAEATCSVEHPKTETAVYSTVKVLQYAAYRASKLG